MGSFGTDGSSLAGFDDGKIVARVKERNADSTFPSVPLFYLSVCGTVDVPGESRRRSVGACLEELARETDPVFGTGNTPPLFSFFVKVLFVYVYIFILCSCLGCARSRSICWVVRPFVLFFSLYLARVFFLFFFRESRGRLFLVSQASIGMSSCEASGRAVGHGGSSIDFRF